MHKILSVAIGKKQPTLKRVFVLDDNKLYNVLFIYVVGYNGSAFFRLSKFLFFLQFLLLHYMFSVLIFYRKNYISDPLFGCCKVTITIKSVIVENNL